MQPDKNREVIRFRLENEFPLGKVPEPATSAVRAIHTHVKARVTAYDARTHATAMNCHLIPERL